MTANKLRRILFFSPGFLLASAAVCGHLECSSPTVFPVLFIALLLLFFLAPAVKDRRIKVVSAVLAAFFALFCILAKLEAPATGLMGLLLRFAGLWLFFACLIAQSYRLLSGLCLTLDEKKVRDLSVKRLIGIFAGCSVVLVGWFSLWMLYRFPGCLSPDSTWQLMQARGLGPLSNHHPIAHTMIIRLCINLGMLLSGNPSVALAVYTLVQLTMLAFCFSYLIVSMYRLRVKFFFILTVFLSFILLPSHAAIGVTILKDVWFSGFVLLLCTTMWRISVLFSEEGRISRWDTAMLFVSSLGMCLFRTNGLYAFILFLPFALGFLFRKSKAAALMPTLALALALLITGPVYSALGIVPPDTIESLSIPAQHISRAIVEGAQLSEKQLELLSHVMDVTAVPDTYTSWLSDHIKDLVRKTGDQEYLAAHKGDFLKLWLELGLKNPGAYLRAQIGLTCGYWYPKTDGTVVYPYFTQAEANAELCLLPAPLAAVIAFMARTIPQLPLIRYFFSNGAAVWLLFILLFLCIAKKQYSKLLLFVPVLAVWLTLIIATPLDNEFRYAYSVFTTLPVLLAASFSHVNNHKANATAPQ